ncbi:MAG: TlpA family protein disulfide reductase [Armatimonadetes bacterium]|nr:TlpA family protein disulfide reductase [Armatimonadota bacterium]
MIPHEKDMVARLKDRPFALIGINSDGDRSVLGKILKEQGITWRQAVDGSTEGPLAKKWGVRGWPTIYVLDKKGVIRFKDLRDKELEEAVMKLLAEP